jgi:hypothetical protein
MILIEGTANTFIGEKRQPSFKKWELKKGITMRPNR